MSDHGAAVGYAHAVPAASGHDESEPLVSAPGGGRGYPVVDAAGCAGSQQKAHARAVGCPQPEHTDSIDGEWLELQVPVLACETFYPAG